MDRESPVPLARQIQEQIERLIREGWLAPGVKLPATRELARALGVNRTTVSLAYEELVAAGRARAHVGQGTFVAAPPAGEARAVPLGPGARAARLVAPLLAERPHRAVGGGAAGGRAGGHAAPPGLLRRGHARQQAVPDRRVPPSPQPGRAGGGRGAAPVPAGRRWLSAAARVPRHLPPPVRRGGARGGHPRGERLPAGLRPDRAHVRGSGRRRGHGAAHLPPRDRRVPGGRGPAGARALGPRGAVRGGAGAGARPPPPEALLLPADRPQPYRRRR